jgi:uncharacterized protein YbdZ (MbtH family)
VSHKTVSALLLVLCALSMASLSAAQNGPKLNEDLPAGAVQQKARTACLECHEARIIVQQRLSKATWTKEVDKMMKWGAVVEANDRDALIDYLSLNFSQDRPAYGAPHTSREKTSGKSTTEKSFH